MPTVIRLMSLLPLVALVALASACQPEEPSCQRGEGAAEAYDIELGRALIKAITNQSNYRLTLVQPASFDSGSVVVRTQPNLLSGVGVRVNVDNILFVNQNRCLIDSIPEVEVTSFSWSLISNQGAGQMRNQGQLRVSGRIENIGSGTMDLNVTTSSLPITVQNAGTGNLTLRGQGSNWTILNSSNGITDLRGVPLSSATVNLDSQRGRVYLNVGGSVSGVINGNDTLYLSGAGISTVTLGPGARGAVVRIP